MTIRRCGMSIFNQLGIAVTSAAQEATDQARNHSEITRLNSMISDLEKHACDCFCKLGKACYEENKDNKTAKNQNIMTEIKEIYQQIASLEDNIANLKGIQKCPACGAEVSISASFCSNCGNRLPTADKPSVLECPNCHTVINEEDRFCYVCGNALPNNLSRTET